MKANMVFSSSSTLLLTTLLALFSSCGESKSNDSDRPTRTPIESAQTRIDTTSWLKSSAGIRGIFEDSRGNLWFSSTDFVCVFDGSKFTYFTEKDGLCGLGRVQEDQNGTIWIGSGFKVCSYDGRQFSSHALTPDDTGNKWGASANDLWFHKGIRRFGETKGPPGIYRFHDGQITFLAFPIQPYEGDDDGYSSSTGAIKGMDGTTWFGTMEAAIGFKDGSFTFITREEMGRKEEPRDIGIRALFEDSKGNLWIGDNGGGVYVYSAGTIVNFTRLHKLGSDDTDGNSLHRIFSIGEDNDGNMWFGTVYSGVWRFDGKTFTNFVEEYGITSDVIWTIYKTKQGELLFGGENPGAVYKFDGTSFYRAF